MVQKLIVTSTILIYTTIDALIWPKVKWTYWKNCESLILDYLDFHEIKHDDQIGYEEVRAMYLLLLEKNRAHFAEHDIELLMTTVLQRYSIESIGHMREAELNEWSYCIGKYLNDFQFKKVSLTEEETKLVLKEKNLMAKISGNMCEILLDFTAGSELDFNDECELYL